MAIRLSFRSGSSVCAAWLTLPAGEGPHPVVVLVHGGGATHPMKLDQYEAWFSAAGLAVLAFDYRGFGESGGEPRQVMSARLHLEDIAAAIDFVHARPGLDCLDPQRIALWGTSFGASHVVVTAARRADLAAAVVQCPVLKGRAPALRSGIGNLLRLTGPILSDALRAALGLSPIYLPIVGRPGERAFVTVPGACDGWYSVVPEGYAFDNRVAARSALGLFFYDAASYARRVKCPLLVCVSDREELIDPAISVKAAKDAPLGVAKHYATGHFGIYHSPFVEQAVADQIAFLVEHLKPSR